MFLKILYTILLSQVFFSPPSLYAEAEAEGVDAFLQQLSAPQKALLHQFFFSLVKNSFTGYVLFGDKPLCIEGYAPTEDTGIICRAAEPSTLLIRGSALWRALNVNSEDKEYFFLDIPFEDYFHHLLWINRKAFLHAVDDNIALFRYVLGPTMTSEQLLSQILKTPEQFYEIIKDDNTLLGILLGYGTENSLYVAREEYVNDAFYKAKREEFPYLAKETRMSMPPCRAETKRPSLGFYNISEELDTLRSSTVVSRGQVVFNECPIPYFGLRPGTKESQELLARYVENRKTILQAVEKESFLKTVLAKCFLTVEGKLDIPQNFTLSDVVLPTTDLKERATTFGRAVASKLSAEEYFEEGMLRAYCDGVHRALTESEYPTSPTVESMLECYHTEKLLQRTRHRRQAEYFLQIIKKADSSVVIFPERLYFRVIKEGRGDVISPFTQTVSFHHSVKIHDDEGYFDMGTVKEGEMKYFLPAVILSLMGMKIGEQREVYLHPDFGYSVDGYRPAHRALIASIELLDFKNGSEAMVIPVVKETINVTEAEEVELLARCRALQREQFYQSGLELAHILKTHEGMLFCESFLQALKSGIK